MLPVDLPELNPGLSWKDEEEFGGVKFMVVSHSSMRAFEYLKARANCVIWLTNLAQRAREHQGQQWRHTQFWIGKKGEYARRQFESKEEALGFLYSLGQRVLKQEQTNKKVNFEILYEWGSYALYRQNMQGELMEMAGRARGQW